MKIALTGSSGFVGGVLQAELLKLKNTQLNLIVRSHQMPRDASTHPFCFPVMDEKTDFTDALRGCDAVIHLAARVHVMQESASNPLPLYRKTNTALTLNLARQAAECGVRRFVFISTIKVNGEGTQSGQRFGPEDKVSPIDPYALSKYEAEIGLKAIAEETGMEIVVIRPPLIYGPGVKGNFKTLYHWVYKGLPLPLGKIHNARDMVSVYNLADFILNCLTHPKAANQTFLVSDGQAISTTALLEQMAEALNHKPRLLPFPNFLKSILFDKVSFLSHRLSRLLGSLEVDISKNRTLVGWEPKAHRQQVLKEMASRFEASN